MVPRVRRSRFHYGSHHSQVGYLWRDERRKGALPVVVLLHGGFWRLLYTKRLMNTLARALARDGVAVWNVEYRRLGGGNGWRSALFDVSSAIEFLGEIAPEVGLDLGSIVTCGHSAGGQLALWAAARHKPAAGLAGPPPKVQVRGALSLAGVADLARADELDLGRGAVRGFIGGTPGQVPERYRAASPAELLPIGVPQVLVHGLRDATVPATMSEHYQQAALAGGDDVSYLPLPGIDHRQVVDPHSRAFPAIKASIEALIRDGPARRT